ncbi:MAG: hypothetical protein KatS3mg124_2319 [Porticoccaceae bacterium]|nr:MAG: hypothetical protein KatS3mg124_2319 [Porticoccaceae bacterium]
MPLTERYLVLSPQLAATLGLEEALLYQLLVELRTLTGGGDGTVAPSLAQLLALAPFWSEADLRRLLLKLRAQGVIDFPGAPFAAHPFVITFGDDPGRATASAPPAAQLPEAGWRPAADVVAQLEQYGLPRQFIEEQIPEFVAYWQARDEPRHGWHARFLRHALRRWREAEAATARAGRATAMTPDWRPAPEAVELLTRQAGVAPHFVEDCIPEFVLYWRERGERRSTWNTDFVRHVRLQWARYRHAVAHDRDPQPLPAAWRPAAEVWEVLELANIPREFAERQLPEFILYWRENGQPCSSWNTRFLQHVKRQWARQAAPEGRDGEEGRGSPADRRLRERSLEEALSDRSWAF